MKTIFLMVLTLMSFSFNAYAGKEVDTYNKLVKQFEPIQQEIERITQCNIVTYPSWRDVKQCYNSWSYGNTLPYNAKLYSNRQNLSGQTMIHLGFEFQINESKPAVRLFRVYYFEQNQRGHQVLIGQGLLGEYKLGNNWIDMITFAKRGNHFEFMMVDDRVQKCLSNPNCSQGTLDGYRSKLNSSTKLGTWVKGRSALMWNMDENSFWSIHNKLKKIKATATRSALRPLR